MSFRNLKIGTQLRLGLGLIMFFSFFLGAVAWYESNSLWSQTEGLYLHPLKTRRALAELKTDVLKIHRSMKDILLASSEAQRQQEIANIAQCESDAFRQIDSLSVAYLGPREDIVEVYNAMVRWKPVRDHTLKMMSSGNVDSALFRTTRSGAGGMQVDQIMKAIDRISVFAINRADSFYEKATENKSSLVVFIFMLTFSILIVSFIISIILIRAVRNPLTAMNEVANAYREGKLETRITQVPGNEFGALAEALNRMAEEVSVEMRLRDRSAYLNNVMLKEEELNSFCQGLINSLIVSTGSHTAVVYLLNTEKTAFEPYTSIGLRWDHLFAFPAGTFEGEIGRALLSRHVEIVRDIPDDTPLVFHTSAGDFRAKEVMTIPILSAKEVVAIISLASLSRFSTEAERLIDDIMPALTARFNGVLAHQKIIEFSERLEVQNRDLDEKASELALQGSELTRQNVELEMQKNQLDEANRLKSTFLSNMSHELRTPLNSVIALSGVLGRRLKNNIPEDEYSYLEIIERNGKNLLTLINDLLDLSRIEAGHEEISVTNFSLFDLCGEVVSMLMPQAESKHIGLLNLAPKNIPEIRSDYIKCRHVLQNLVANAVKFTESGTVEVSAEMIEKEVRISVTDTGIGIDEKDLPFIFDEFRQADSGSSRKFGGTGLGLSIARKYAGMLQGEIRVESKPGKGSIFTFFLPMALDIGKGTKVSVQEQPVKSKSQAKFHASRSGAGKTIMLFEDSEPAIIQITEILREQLFTVHVAKSGIDAIEQIRLYKPDGIILDLMMPEVDGFQVLKMIRENSETMKIPVLILTAKHITPQELSVLRGNHIHQLIQKGDVKKAELLAAVDSMVNPSVSKNLQSARKSARKPGSARPVILVVEDNPDNMKTAKALLEQDFTVLEAFDGREGVRIALEHSPDLILMDMSLPQMDGFEAFDEIRKSPGHIDIPIVALTASAMKGSREEILDYGFDDYVTKPIDEPMFMRVLDHYLGGREK